MAVDSEMGVVESEEVEDALQAHFEEVRDCYGRAGDAQRYAAGRVLLRFVVSADGRPQDVWVIESTLGNYEVERCLVAVGRRIRFRAPGGHKGTTFEYPVEFRSAEQVPVLEVDGLKVERDLATLLPGLASCGQLASAPVNAILYIEADGSPGSVGLAVPGPLDETVGACMVESMRKWKMSVKLPKHVMRATFTIPPVIATAEVASPRPTRKHARRR